MASNLKARPLDAILADLNKVGFGPVTIRAIQDVIIRSDKTLTDTGGLTAKTPLPGAVDASGNLLLKNVMQPTAVTNNPTVNNFAFVVIPEMTQPITTKGNRVLLLFTGAFQFGISVSGSDNGYVQLYRDGAAIGPQYFTAKQFSASPDIFMVSLSYLDTVAAGVHTYEVRYAYFNSGSGSNFKAVSTLRSFQMVELG